MRDSVLDRVCLIDRQYLYAAALRRLLEESGSADATDQFTSVEQFLDGCPSVNGSAAGPVLVIIDEAELPPLPEETIHLVRGRFESCRVICTTTATTREDALALIAAGADGVILKTQSERDTLEGILAVARGGAYFPAALLPSRRRAAPEPWGRGLRLPGPIHADRARVESLRAGADEADSATAEAGQSLGGQSLGGKSLGGHESHARFIAPGPLSSRQSSVYALVAEGKSNKAIARELNLAEATVKVHVRNIFRVLRIKSRYQAISYFHQLNQRASSFVASLWISFGGGTAVMSAVPIV